MTKIIVIFFLAFTCLVSSNSHASEHIATVVAVRGGVTAETVAGKIRKLKMRDLVFRNETIKTGKRGRIQLLFVDKTIISLARSTVMNIADYSWDKSSKKGEMRTKIKEGTFRIMGGAITKFAPKQFTTETPTATIGIRGSMYAGTVTSTSLAVVFQAGRGIDIMNDAGAVVITRPGFGTMVHGLNTAPNPPKKFTAADMAVINNALTGPLEPLQEGTDEKVNDGENAGQQDPANSGETEGDQESGTAEQQTTQQTDSGEATANNGDTASTDGTAPPPDGQAPPEGGTEGFLPPPDDVLLSGPVDLSGPVLNTTPLPTAPIPNALDVTSTGLPPNRVLKYSGSFSGSDSVSSSIIQGPTYFGMNTRNNKFFGVLEDQGNNTDPNGSPTFFFGSINGTSITDIRIFGSDGGDLFDPQNHVSALTGNGSGYLAGINNDVFNFTASGNEYRLDVGNVVAESNYTVSGTAGQQATGSDLVASTGSSMWEGFFVGIAEDVNNINSNRKRYANTLSSDFSFTVNKDNGTISGSMSGSDFGFYLQSAAGGITSIKIGEAAGVGDSAYIDNGMFGALLGCPAGACVSTNGGTPQGLKPYGNYFITEDPQKQFSPWLAWGYWEAAFTDELGHQYHAHVPGTTWIAGEKTPSAAVSNLITNNFVATYNGIAHGTMFDSTGPGAELSGISTTIINFGSSNVSGNLTLNGSVYNLGGSSYVGPGGFYAQVIGATPPTPRAHAVEGAFFGPNAEAVGGNFLFDIGTKSYTGILGGSR